METDTIYAALTAYLMLGLTRTMAYVLTEQFNTGSIRIGTEMRVPTGMDLLYFSYVTLTTLEYGDITPVNIGASSLAISEALTGVLYLAVLILRLVGAWSPDASPEDAVTGKITNGNN